MAINCAIDLVPFHSLSKLKLADPAHVKVGFFFFFFNWKSSVWWRMAQDKQNKKYNFSALKDISIKIVSQGRLFYSLTFQAKSCINTQEVNIFKCFREFSIFFHFSTDSEDERSFLCGWLQLSLDFSHWTLPCDRVLTGRCSFPVSQSIWSRLHLQSMFWLLESQ